MTAALFAHCDVSLMTPLVLCRLFCHKEAREEAMYSTRVVVDIIDCLGHRNSAVRTAAEKLCDIGTLKVVSAEVFFDRLFFCQCSSSTAR